MPEIEYLAAFMIFFAVWAVCFLICGQTWQLVAAFIPFSIGAYLYYGKGSSTDLLMLYPILAVFVVDIHIVLSKPKFSGLAWYLSYLLVLPLLLTYIYFASRSEQSMSWFAHLSIGVMIIFAGKMWFSDVLLLIINRLWISDKTRLQTRINNTYIKGAGKSRAFYASIYQLGDIEISGFFYWYVRLKKISSQDQIELVVKKGWLGTEFIAGFPKLLSHKDS